MFVQYAPFELKGTTWDAERERSAERCFDILNEYAPNFRTILHLRGDRPAGHRGASVGHSQAGTSCRGR